MIWAIASMAAGLAFPGALGFGADAEGGHLGDVCIVTRLDDDIPAPPESLRDCLENCECPTCPRYTLSDVGGPVALVYPIVVGCPMTFAGQSAPGDGITILGYGVWIPWSFVGIDFRIRLGDAHWDPDQQWTGQPVVIYAQARGVVFDHVSIAHYHDDINVLWTKTTGYADAITFQDCLIAEPLGGKGLLIGMGQQPEGRVSLLYNLVASSNSRHPQAVNYGTGPLTLDWSYNLVFGMGGGKSQAGINTNPSAPLYVRARGNIYRRGAAGAYQNGGKVHLVATYSWPFFTYPIVATLERGQDAQFGNVLDGWASDPTETAANWAGTWTFAWLPTPYELPDTYPAETYARVLDGAGASPRDAIDLRIADEVVSRGGSIKTTAPVWPEWTTSARAAGWDTDRDGMPNGWEVAHGLDPEYDDHNLDLDGDGWTEIEEYLNEGAT